MQTALLLNKTSLIHEIITKTALISSNCRWNKAGVCISDCYLDFYYSEWRPKSEWPKTDISRGPPELNQCQQTCPETSPWMEGRENTHRHPVLGVTAQATEPSPWSIQPIKCKAPSISASTGVYSRKHCLLNWVHRVHWTALHWVQKSLADTVQEQLNLPESHFIWKICLHLWRTIPMAILTWKISLFLIANGAQERIIFKTWDLCTSLIKSRNIELQVKCLSTNDRRTKFEGEKQRK